MYSIQEILFFENVNYNNFHKERVDIFDDANEDIVQ